MYSYLSYHTAHNMVITLQWSYTNLYNVIFNSICPSYYLSGISFTWVITYLGYHLPDPSDILAIFYLSHGILEFTLTTDIANLRNHFYIILIFLLFFSESTFFNYHPGSTWAMLVLQCTSALTFTDNLLSCHYRVFTRNAL